MKPKLTINALKEMLELDIDLIFTFTPTALRLACEDCNVAEELAAILQSMAGRHTRGFADTPLLYNDVDVKPREGFAIPLTDNGWLIRMQGIAYSGFAYGPDHPLHIDPDETPTVPEEQCMTDKAVQVTPSTEREYYLNPTRDGYFEIPNLITGASFFCTGARSKPRKYWTKAKPLVVNRVSGQRQGEYTITYTGEELRPGDIETFTQVLKQAAELPLGRHIQLKTRNLLQNIPGRGTGTNSYKSIGEELTRLQDAKLQIKSTCKQFIATMYALFPDDETVQNAVETGYVCLTTHLLSSIYSNGKNSYSVGVPVTVSALFGKKLASWFNEYKYYSIKGDTARRLYLLYGSHTGCWPLTLADMREFLGSGMEEDTNFRKSLAKAHDELKAKGLIGSWRYEVPEYGRKTKEKCYVVFHKEKAFTKKPAKTVEA